MQRKIIDTHTHYAHKRFDYGRHEILSSLEKHNIVAVMEGAIEFETNEKMLRLCEKYPYVYMAAGCHPNCVEEMDEGKMEVIRKLLHHDKVLAIGETGLDYHKEKSTEHIKLQKQWFRRFLELSLETGKPLVIHCRKAYEDLIHILEENSLGNTTREIPRVIHCFSGNWEQAKRFLEMGFYLGINGKFTNLDEDSDVRKALKQVPLNRIVLETDAPYLMPQGLEGKRNTSLNLPYVIQAFAKLRQMDEDTVTEEIWENTKKVYSKIFDGFERIDR